MEENRAVNNGVQQPKKGDVEEKEETKTIPVKTEGMGEPDPGSSGDNGEAGKDEFTPLASKVTLTKHHLKFKVF